MDDPGLPKTPEDVARWISQALSRGVADPKSAFHWPTLVTSGAAASGIPQARTVVLRGFKPQERRLTFYTDIRSGKIRELTEKPLASVHVHDQRRRVQLRLSGPATIHTDDDVWQHAWEKARQGRTADYAAPMPPGTPMKEGDLPAGEGADPANNFAALTFVYTDADYLHLGRSQHRRAGLTFTRDEEAPTDARWLVP